MTRKAKVTKRKKAAKKSGLSARTIQRRAAKLKREQSRVEERASYLDTSIDQMLRAAEEFNQRVEMGRIQGDAYIAGRRAQYWADRMAQEEAAKRGLQAEVDALKAKLAKRRK